MKRIHPHPILIFWAAVYAAITWACLTNAASLTSIDAHYSDGSKVSTTAPSVLTAAGNAIAATQPTPPPTPPANQKWSDVKPVNGVYTLTAGVTYDCGTVPIKLVANGIFIGMKQSVPGKADPILLFNPPNGSEVGLFDCFGADATGGTTIEHVQLKASSYGQLMRANKGAHSVMQANVISGAGLVTMMDCDTLYLQDITGVAQRNMIYTGTVGGAGNGLLKLRNVNLSGGMLYEHGLRTHALDTLDWDGGTFDGSGSTVGKDVLTIHELRKSGIIQNVHFKGWATIGGLGPDSPPVNAPANLNAVVDNLTIQHCTFDPCTRSSPTSQNGARIYVLSGVSNFQFVDNTVNTADSDSFLWTKDYTSAKRPAPTGTIQGITATGKGKFISGDAALPKMSGNTFNGKAQ